MLLDAHGADLASRRRPHPRNRTSPAGSTSHDHYYPPSVVKQQRAVKKTARRAGARRADIDLGWSNVEACDFEDFPHARAGFRQRSRAYSSARKEVIQPQVPLRLPCYDFAPVTALAFGRLVCLATVPARTSGAHSFHGVTGGVYKARERIHRGVADPRLLAIPASCSRVADCNPN